MDIIYKTRLNTKHIFDLIKVLEQYTIKTNDISINNVNYLTPKYFVLRKESLIYDVYMLTQEQ